VADAGWFLRDAIADALLDSLDRGGRRFASFMSTLLAWLRRAAEPPRGLELRSVDGAAYTGIALFEKNVVIAMLAVRHAPEEAHQVRSDPQRVPEAYRYPDDGPLWRERPTYR
jgi:hypothetical protein